MAATSGQLHSSKYVHLLPAFATDKLRLLFYMSDNIIERILTEKGIFVTE